MALGPCGSGACACRLSWAQILSDGPLASGFPVTLPARHTWGDCTGSSRVATHLFLSAGAALPGSGSVFTPGPWHVPRSTRLRKGNPLRAGPSVTIHGVPLSGQSFTVLLLFKPTSDGRENQSPIITMATPKTRAPGAAAVSWQKPEPASRTGRLGSERPGHGLCDSAVCFSAALSLRPF